MKRLAIALLALWPPTALAAQSPKELTEAESVLETLVESYGPSGMEGPVREAVRKALPSWANPQTDSAGNLWVTLGQGEPTIVFVAHLDEVGFVVRGIEESGLLALEPLGGIFPELWESRPALVHTGTTTVPGVFQPHDSSGALRVDLGTESRTATEALGVRIGNTVTMPKEYVRLSGTRATGRSFDDRVGCDGPAACARTARSAAAPAPVIFVWSVREEIGLEGAQVVADALRSPVRRGSTPSTPSSPPIPRSEPRRFAVAPLGQRAGGARAGQQLGDPAGLVDSLVALARHRGIPLQVGATNGGNDGSVFGAVRRAGRPRSAGRSATRTRQPR